MEQQEEKQTSVSLELGDIIKIYAPENSDINQDTFFIKYIDQEKLIIVDIATFKTITLKIDSDKKFTDKSIRQIDLLDRSPVPGYARQNGLLLGVWVNIHFLGDLPMVITGEITSLEEDQIEITTFPHLEIIYIDFEYKGLPEHLPIEKIVIREKPSSIKNRNLTELRDIDENQEELEVEEGEKGEGIEEGELQIKPDEEGDIEDNVYDTLRQYIHQSNIVLGDYLNIVSEKVEITESQKRYGIETQINSLLDELLSKVPNSERNPKFMSQIHRIIERYKELREQFSKYDENENIKALDIKHSSYKPLIKRLIELDTKLKWVLPVVSVKKKIYVEKNADKFGNMKELAIYTIGNELFKQSEIEKSAFYENKLNSSNIKYVNMFWQTHDLQTPFNNPEKSASFITDGRIKTNFEAIVDNANDFKSTVINGLELAQQKYVIQTFNIGLDHLTSTISNGKQLFVREQMTPSDQIYIKSILFLNRPVMEYSRIDLKMTPMIERSNLHLSPFSLFRVLRKGRKIFSNEIDDLTKPIDYKTEDEEGVEFLSSIAEYVLDENTGIGDPEKYRKMLDVIIPKTRDIIHGIRKYITDKVSLVSIVRYLEPFLIYASDICYDQYNEIRYFMKHKIREIRKKISEKTQTYKKVKDHRYEVEHKKPAMEIIVREEKSLHDFFTKSYKLEYDTSAKYQTSQEILAKVFAVDFGILLTEIINDLLIPLKTVNIILDQEVSEDAGNTEKILAKDCAKRVIAKRYLKVENLQKDNGDDAFFDQEFDDTPYHILKKYSQEKKTMLETEFAEFFAENLIAKHDCAPQYAEEMAATIISGKRRVESGQYAILELRPALPKGMDEDSLDQKTKEAMKIESDVRVQYHYYKRIGHNWVLDRDVDENTFVDNNTLFCNMQQDCTKTEYSCEPNVLAKNKMKELIIRQAKKEFDRRYDTDVKDLQKTIENEIETQMRRIIRLNTMRQMQLEKRNNYEAAIASLAIKDDHIQSPYLRGRDLILGQENFAKKQADICVFAELFTREPLEHLEEDAHWRYCLQTNMKLLPIFIYDLAYAFIEGDYMKKLEEVCAKNGQLSDDGDSIVDKYSGYVIRKLDFSTEEGFTEEGFRITTHGIMEKEMGAVILENLGKRVERVFNSETNEKIYKIFAFLSANMGISTDSIDEFVCRLSFELSEKNILSKNTYEEKKAEVAKKEGINMASYGDYRNETLILIVSCVLLVGIQTAIPSFYTKKTYPGCIKSLDGYPMKGEEDLKSLAYIACILHKSKSSIEPWNAINKFKASDIQKRMKRICDSVIMKNAEVEEKYFIKRSYIELHPNEFIPEQYSIQKWYTYKPPLIPVEVIKYIKSIPDHFKDDFLRGVQKGQRNQNAPVLQVLSSLERFGYGIVEAIQEIVANKTLLLKTASKQPFLQNTCCNEAENPTRPIDYFTKENGVIAKYVKEAAIWSTFVRDVRVLERAPLHFHLANTELVRPPIPQSIFYENIYEVAIHYLELDRPHAIPAEFHHIMTKKPADYNPAMPIMEKIAILKRNGVELNEGKFHEIMHIVHRRTMVTSSQIEKITYSSVNMAKDLLTHLSSKTGDSDMGAYNVLTAILEKYDKRIMHPVNDDDLPYTELDNMKRFFSKQNEELYERIWDFMDVYGNLSKTQLTKMGEFLRGITVSGEKNTNIYDKAKFVKNAIYEFTCVFPNMIINKSQFYTIPTHWNLSDFDDADIYNEIKKCSGKFQEFADDEIICRILKDLQYIDIFTLVKTIPIYRPLEQGGIKYCSLFDERGIQLLLSYTLFSILVELIRMAEDDRYIRMDIIVAKNERRDKIREQGYNSEFASNMDMTITDDAYDEYDAELQNVQIDMGNKEELKKRVAFFIRECLVVMEKNAATSELSYADIAAKLKISRDKEKKRITENFKKLSIEERNVENMLKERRLGKWNVGQQRGLFIYDKATSDRERAEMMQQEGIVFDLGQEEHEREDEGGRGDDGEDEGGRGDDGEDEDFIGLPEEYMDNGAYYEEDFEDGF
jgi:hypothetical protein